MLKLHLIGGARPNFMKIAPLYHALKQEQWCEVVLVHTGQHYDQNMSDDFFRDLGLPTPDVQLGAGSGTHAVQTAAVMTAYESICLKRFPDWTIVVGDVNSTMACTLVAKKLCISVAHVEAGLRSRDRTMPEEINRIVTDALADLLWTPSSDADENLLREGVPENRIQLVGNIMIDSYELLRDAIERKQTRRKFHLEPRQYGVVTLHRPSNVDDEKTLETIIGAIRAVARRLPLVFVGHPRTRQRLEEFGLSAEIEASTGIHFAQPMGYVEFMGLARESKFVITDSGGLQEETTYLGIPCLTLRETTERPVTVTHGTNRLVRAENLIEMVSKVLEDDWPQGACPKLWDGGTAERIVESLKSHAGVGR